MAKMDDRELLSIVDGEFQSAMGDEGGQISLERARAWRYYMREPFGNEVENESSVVTSDVSDVVNSLMPSLLRVFTTADNVASFDPTGPEDVEKAEQESDYINHLFFKKQPAFMILYTWMFDALVQKNGYVKAWWDDSEVVTYESYKGLSESELADLLDDDELEPIERDERIAETVGEDGQTIVQDTVYDINFRRKTKNGRLRVEGVPPEEIRISADARGIDPTPARMVAQERLVSRSELISMGFDRTIVDDLSADGGQFRGEEEIARRNKTDEQYDSPGDKSQELVRLREAYIRVDYDGDGVAELRQVFSASNQLLGNEPFDRQPFHALSPRPLPHKHHGMSSAEEFLDVQETSSTLLRQVLQNLYHTNNPKHAVWEQGIGEDTLDDLLSGQIGGITRFARPVGESYAPMTVPFTAGASFPMLEYFDKVKRDRAGVANDSEGLSPDALKHVQTTTMSQAADLGRMKIEAIARIFAETGIRSLFLHMHELMLKHSEKAEVVKLRNRWVQVNPQEWRTRHDMTVQIGLGVGSRDANLVHLNAIWDKQRQMIEAGGMNLTVTPDNVYHTAAEFVKNANLKTPEMFFTDPQGQPAPPPPDELAELEAERQRLDQRRQQLDAQRNEINQGRLALDTERAQFNAEKESAEFEHKRDMDLTETEIKTQRLQSDIDKARNDDEMRRAELRLREFVAEQQAILSRAQAQQMTRGTDEQ